jgi:phosphoribosylformimino-5-aminoimidazole carboxamide ribotide isomerase
MFLNIGVNRVIIGTEAIRNSKFVINAAKRYPGQIIVGIDAREGWVAVEGWTEMTRVRAIDLAKRFDDCGLAAINFTDILRDGMQTGINIKETRQFAAAISTPVIASGGVATIEDIKRVISLKNQGVVGVITGKALYSGTLDLHEAIQLAKKAGA